MTGIATILDESDKAIVDQLLERKTLTWQQRKRLHALLLADKGMGTVLIAKQLCVKVERVRKYLQTYRKYGVDAVINMEKPGKESLLTEEMFQALEKYIENSKKCGRGEMTEFLKEHYQIELTPEWLARRLLQRRLALKEQPWK